MGKDKEQEACTEYSIGFPYEKSMLNDKDSVTYEQVEKVAMKLHNRNMNEMFKIAIVMYFKHLIERFKL